MSSTLLKVHKRGGKAVLLSQYEVEKEKNADDLMARLDKINNTQPWQ